MSLVLHFEGREITVTATPFVIGRDGRGSDLRLQDNRVSRQHAAILYLEGQYYLRDLWSKNGVQHGGLRIAVKRIEEGDVFRIVAHELRFTFR